MWLKILEYNNDKWPTFLSMIVFSFWVQTDHHTFTTKAKKKKNHLHHDMKNSKDFSQYSTCLPVWPAGAGQAVPGRGTVLQQEVLWSYTEKGGGHDATQTRALRSSDSRKEDQLHHHTRLAQHHHSWWWKQVSPLSWLSTHGDSKRWTAFLWQHMMYWEASLCLSLWLQMAKIIEESSLLTSYIWWW